MADVAGTYVEQLIVNDGTIDSDPETVTITTGGAAPPSAVIAGMEALSFRVIHLYGLTETYGPALISAYQDDWMEMSVDDRAAVMSRQGLRHQMVAGNMVADADTMEPVTADGETIGEIMMRGNTVMKRPC